MWQQYSLALNADKIKTPLLMQLSDDEFRLALEAYEELKSRSRPVDMLVFLDEYHIKWQPAHRLAVYRRAVDWFDFWLNHKPPQDEQDRARWQALAADSIPLRVGPQNGDVR